MTVPDLPVQRCGATTHAKRACTKAPYSTTWKFELYELTGKLPNAETRCGIHLTDEEKTIIKQAERTQDEAFDLAINVDPACWSWVVTDEIRADLAASEATADLREKVGLFFRAMRAFDHGRCAICGGIGNGVEDHDHETGLVRGWLCRSCNIREGMYRGDHHVWGRYRRWHPYKMLGLKDRYWDGFTGEWAPENPPPDPARRWKDNPMRGIGL